MREAVYPEGIGSLLWLWLRECAGVIALDRYIEGSAVPISETGPDLEPLLSPCLDLLPDLAGEVSRLGDVKLARFKKVRLRRFWSCRLTLLSGSR